MPYFWPRNTMRKSPSTHLAVCGCKQHADFGNLRFVRFQAELIAYALPLLIFRFDSPGTSKVDFIRKTPRTNFTGGGAGGIYPPLVLWVQTNLT